MSHKVVRTYFDILEDTYLCVRLPPWRKSKNRRMILTEKFYLFDVGVTNYLARHRPQLGSMEFGKSFEQYILMELRAYQAYQNPDLPLSYWQTSTGQEGRVENNESGRPHSQETQESLSDSQVWELNPQRSLWYCAIPSKSPF